MLLRSQPFWCIYEYFILSMIFNNPRLSKRKLVCFAFNFVVNKNQILFHFKHLH